MFSGATTHLKHLPKGLGNTSGGFGISLWSVKVRRLVCLSEGDAHFHEEGTKGRPHTGPSSEIILGSSESLIDLINSHLLAATLCQELW